MLTLPEVLSHTQGPDPWLCTHCVHALFPRSPHQLPLAEAPGDEAPASRLPQPKSQFSPKATWICRGGRNRGPFPTHSATHHLQLSSGILRPPALPPVREASWVRAGTLESVLPPAVSVPLCHPLLSLRSPRVPFALLPGPGWAYGRPVPPVLWTARDPGVCLPWQCSPVASGPPLPAGSSTQASLGYPSRLQNPLLPHCLNCCPGRSKSGDGVSIASSPSPALL